MKRNIVQIHEDKCNGCGLCVKACHEGAIEMVEGKAKLVSDIYCDGLGDCLPACPTGAIEIIERDAQEFSEDAVKELAKKREMVNKKREPLPCGCPGTMSKMIKGEDAKADSSLLTDDEKPEEAEVPSQLRQWPVQLKLVNPGADYFEGANLLVAADCAAYAYGSFHKDFIKGHVTVIGCPKLDDLNYYQEKITEILTNNKIKSITVVRMEVPCCSGIVSAVKEAILQSKNIVPYREVVLGINGEVK